MRMEKVILTELFKYFGIGVGSTGFVVLLAFLWLHIRIKGNKSKINNLSSAVTEQTEKVQRHEILLAKTSQKLEYMTDQIRENSQKLDKLIDFHLSGKAKRK